MTENAILKGYKDKVKGIGFQDTYEDLVAFRKGINRDPVLDNRSRRTLQFDDLIEEFKFYMKRWDKALDEEMKSMFDDIRDRIDLDQCVCLAVARFSKITLVPTSKTGGGKYCRIGNNSMFQLVFLIKLLPMLSKGKLNIVYFQDPSFSRDEESFLTQLCYKDWSAPGSGIPTLNAKKISILSDPKRKEEDQRAQDTLTNKTIFFSPPVPFDAIGESVQTDTPSLYVSTKVDILIDNAKKNSEVKMLETLEKFKEASERRQFTLSSKEIWNMSIVEIRLHEPAGR